MKNKIGSISLIAAVSGFLFLHISISYFGLTHLGWHILLAGFEAGTVGALADWFAVSALFREIQIPFLRKHSNIIVKNRKQLTKGVSDLVTNEWLTPEVITAKISGIDFSEKIIGLFTGNENKKKVLNFVTQLLEKFIDEIDRSEIVSFIETSLKDQLRNFNFSLPLGHWIQKSIRHGNHKELWVILSDTLQKSINTIETREMIADLVDKKAMEYAGENTLKNILVAAGYATNAIDRNSIAEKLVDTAVNTLEDVKHNENNPLRKKIDSELFEFAEKLMYGDVETTVIVTKFQKKLVENIESHNLIKGMLHTFKNTLKNQIHADGTLLSKQLEIYFDKILNELKNN